MKKTLFLFVALLVALMCFSAVEQISASPPGAAASDSIENLNPEPVTLRSHTELAARIELPVIPATGREYSAHKTRLVFADVRSIGTRRPPPAIYHPPENLSFTGIGFDKLARAKI